MNRISGFLDQPSPDDRERQDEKGVSQWKEQIVRAHEAIGDIESCTARAIRVKLLDHLNGELDLCFEVDFSIIDICSTGNFEYAAQHVIEELQSSIERLSRLIENLEDLYIDDDDEFEGGVA